MISRMAGRQHGVVALPQLRELGLSATAVRSRVAAGRLHRIHRGVFAVGTPALSAEGRWLAAVLKAECRDDEVSRISVDSLRERFRPGADH